LKEISDNIILNQFRNSETREFAFNLLVSKYKQKLYWHIRRLVISHEDADDVLQDTFIKIWNALDNFREASQLYTWLYRIATNESITHLNKKRKRFFIPLFDSENPLIEKLESDSSFDGDELQKAFQKAILTLPEKQRIIFNMKYYDDLKYEEISEILGTSVGALKASYHIAVKKIEKIIQPD